MEGNILLQTLFPLNKNIHSKLIMEPKRTFHENSSEKALI
jgi:hypothetical protein